MVAMRWVGIFAGIALLVLGTACASEADSDRMPPFPMTNTGPATGSNNVEHPPPGDVRLGECRADPYVGPKATGTLTNHSSKLSNYMISVNFMDEAGTIVANGTGFASDIPAGASATWSAAAFDSDVTAADCSIIRVERLAAE